VLIEQSITKTFSHIHKLKFFAETEVNTIKIYFAPHVPGSVASHQINVRLDDGDKVIFYQHLPHYSFHQYCVLPYEAKAIKNQDYALTIGDLSHLTKELEVTVTYSSLTTAVPVNNPMKVPAENSPPNIKVEAYGKITESKREEAKSFYEGTLRSLSAD